MTCKPPRRWVKPKLMSKPSRDAGPDAPSIALVFPKTAEHTTAEAKSFLLGQLQHASSEATLAVNDAPVKVGPKGYFAHPIELKEGQNRFSLTSPGCEAVTITITRLAAHQQLDQGFHPALPLLKAPVCIQAGKTMPFRLLAPTGTQNVTLTLTPKHREALAVSTPLLASKTLYSETDTLLDTRQGIFAELHQQEQPVSLTGCFEGQLTLPATWQTQLEDETPLTLEATAYSSTGAVLATLKNEYPVTFWTTPRHGRVTATHPVVRTAPNTHGARLAPPLTGATVSVIGKQNGYTQVAYGQAILPWLPSEQVTLLAKGAALPAPVRTVRLLGAGSPFQSPKPQAPNPLPHPMAYQVQVPLPYLVPATVWADPYRLTLGLYGVQDACDFVHQRPAQGPWSGLYVESMPEDWVRLHLEMDSPIAGHQLSWDASKRELQLTVMPYPLDANQWVVAIDPGHGGEEHGAIGLDGVPEKHKTLSAALALKQALKAKGFNRVVLTRHFDETVSLEERARRVAQSGAHVCLSLHYNALPEGRDPWQAKGASTYYYHDFARPLALAVQEGLIMEGRRPDYGLLYDSLAMTRLPFCTAILVELGFLIHPEELDDLNDKPTHDRVIQALAGSVAHFQEIVLNAQVYPEHE